MVKLKHLLLAIEIACLIGIGIVGGLVGDGMSYRRAMLLTMVTSVCACWYGCARSWREHEKRVG
jgi:hypothetical protein